MVVRVFTDGSAKGNGKKNAIGGIGVFFGDSDTRNVSMNLDKFYSKYFPEELPSKATNNKAELCAILEALVVTKSNLDNKEKVVIYSDSMYSINCLTKWWKAWRANEWKNKSKKIISNCIVIKEIVEQYIRKYRELIVFKHINSHTLFSQDFTPSELFEWHGNNAADRLATSFD